MHHFLTSHKILLVVVAVVTTLSVVFGLTSFLGEKSSSPVTNNSYLPEIKRISVEDLKTKLDAGANIIVIDSEPDLNYKISHIVGAVSMPLETMAVPYSNLDIYDEIITYCNWPDEEESARAAQKLIEAGYSNAKALDGGIIAWKSAGFPVESVNDYLPEINRISAEDLKAKLDAGSNIVIIDSRAESYYQISHIVGAISIPSEAMTAPYTNLDGYDEIITYCNWPDEEESARAAQKLTEAGYSNVKALDGGIIAWRDAGFPIESSSP
jgi:rhodanese-related sulfurtransferase